MKFSPVQNDGELCLYFDPLNNDIVLNDTLNQ